MDDLISKARDAIGETEKGDWKIDPTEHAKDLERTAGDLAAHLRKHQNIKDTADQFKTADDKAIRAQEKFKSYTNRANTAIFATACLAASMTVAATLIAGVEAPAGETNTQFVGSELLFAFLGIAGLVASALASMWLGRLRGGNMLKAWLETRAEAERRRLEYFDAVRTAPPQNQLYLELLKLEYFVRYLLGSQIKYFDKRGSEHEAASGKTLDVSTLATAIAAVLAGAAGILAAAIGEGFAALGGLAVMVTAFGAMFSAREGLNQDARNAHRYRATKKSLVDIRKKYTDRVKKDVSDGKNESHVDFVDSVRSVLLEEHAQWLDTSRLWSAAVDRLERRLREASDQEAAPAGG